MRRLAAGATALLLVLLGSGAAAGPASATNSHALISASGSSWSANAVNQWIADVQSNGLQVVFTASGSAQGRKDFANRQNDFGVTDIGFQGTDPETGADDTSDGRAYSYLPIVAGGTSFPYQIKVAGQLVKNLRLSGLTLAKIFTDKITNWDDPEITSDNNGHKLPSLPIIPVVHSEGSGSSAQFTRYLATDFASLWTPFNGGTSNFTEYFPAAKGQVAQNGSDGVMNFVSSAAANGAIGYDEYSYALGKGYPVAKVENKAGYFTLPTQYNVAVALTKAKINFDKSSKDYLLEDLDDVYVDPDKRTYPLSSYSYEVIPTASNDKTMTTAKRQTLADFDYYSICTGQKEMGPIGYSPLPVNLVEAGFQQIAKLHKADSGVNLTKENINNCHNPTFVAGQPSVNHLAQIAPLPLACDKVGAGPCAQPGAPGAPPAAGNGQGGSGSGSGTGGGSGSGSGAGTGSGSGAGTGGGSGATNPGSGGKAGNGNGSSPGGGNTTIDPATGQSVSAAGTSNDAAILGQPTEIPASQNADLLGPLAAILLIVALVGPPLLTRRLRRGRSGP
jgi:ABC-type phosphate transport system substrate-binding protein